MSPLISPAEEHFVFASFQLFPKQRTLARNGTVIAIGGRAFDLLLFLVARAGEVVSLGELMDCVWPAVTVEEANLRVQMGILRKILSQCEGARRAIETVPLRGYCFILPVRHRPQGADRPAAARLSLPALPGAPLGRDEAIKALCAALDERRLVTITGPGGIGKTTVAVATANHYAGGGFDGTVCFVDFSAIVDGPAAAAAIARGLGIAAGTDTVAALCDHLRGCAALLVLDTCEHIVAPMARLVETLLAHCPQLRLLVTSREALRAAGEWTCRLPSLGCPRMDEDLHQGNVEAFPAVALFLERARTSMRLELADADFPLVAEICRRMDGIPLALEFAAARVVDLGLRDIAANLDDRFEILTRGRRTAVPRHRTLTAVFDWSYGLLEQGERIMLGQLARLGAAFSAEQAIALGRQVGCRNPAEAMAGLYEKSLLSVDERAGANFYRLLESTRAYVAGLKTDLAMTA